MGGCRHSFASVAVQAGALLVSLQPTPDTTLVGDRKTVRLLGRVDGFSQSIG